MVRTASEADIKKAFKRASMKVHPDKCSDPHATTVFQRLSEAAAVLSDPAQRSLHDRFPQYNSQQAQAAAKTLVARYTHATVPAGLMGLSLRLITPDSPIYHSDASGGSPFPNDPFWAFCWPGSCVQPLLHHHTHTVSYR